jgi:hypothetical protein
MTEEEVVRTHVGLFNTLKRRNWDELAANYSDDYMLVRPDGSVLSKEEVLTHLRVGGLEFSVIGRSARVCRCRVSAEQSFKDRL